MVVHVICMNEEDSPNNKGARFATTLELNLWGFFPNAQKYLTPQSNVESTDPRYYGCPYNY